MARFNHDEDLDRLPEGFQRIGYDEKTRRYAFRDNTGQAYVGEPDEEYGVMVPVDHVRYPSRGDGQKLHNPAYDRPVLFADGDSVYTTSPPATPDLERSPSSPASFNSGSSSPPPSYHAGLDDQPQSPTTFADILPTQLMTAAPPLSPSRSTPHLPGLPQLKQPHKSQDASEGSRSRTSGSYSLKTRVHAIARTLSVAKRHGRGTSDGSGRRPKSDMYALMKDDMN